MSGAPVDARALLLRSVDYGESDRILTLAVEDHGKLGAIARGARRSQRRFGGALQPFQVLRVSLAARSRSALWILREAELIDSWPTIATNAGKYAFASIVTELMRELTPEGEPSPEPFQSLCSYLAALDGQRRATPRTLARGVLGALRVTGFEPALDRCAACGRAAPEGSAAAFDLARGAVCSACGGAPDVLKGRAREALLAALDQSAPVDCDSHDLAEGVKLLLLFAEFRAGRRLDSRSLAERYLGTRDD